MGDSQSLTPPDGPLARPASQDQTWHIPIGPDSRDGGDRRQTRLTKSPSFLGEHRLLTSLALVVSSALVVYVLAGGLRHVNVSNSGLRQSEPSPHDQIAPTFAPNASPFAVRAPVSPTPFHPRPAPTDVAFASPLPSRSPDRAIAGARNDHHIGKVRHVRHRQASFDKIRAFLRKLF